MIEIQKYKQCFILEDFGHAQRRRLRRVLNIVICDLFVICLPAVFLAGYLEFVILDTKL